MWGTRPQLDSYVPGPGIPDAPVASARVNAAYCVHMQWFVARMQRVFEGVSLLLVNWGNGAYGVDWAGAWAGLGCDKR